MQSSDDKTYGGGEGPPKRTSSVPNKQSHRNGLKDFKRFGYFFLCLFFFGFSGKELTCKDEK